MFARLVLPLSILLAGCTSTADEAPAASSETDPRYDVAYQLTALEPCDVSSSPVRVRPLRVRDEDVLVIQLNALDGSLFKGTLRTPTACQALSACGHLLVTHRPPAGEPHEFRVATPVFEVPLSDTDSLLGVHQITVAFATDDQTPALGLDGEPISQQISVEVVAEDACGP